MRHTVSAAAVASLFLLAPAAAGPVEYVKICSLYGPGFFYIPNTDTCLNADTGETRTQSATGVVYGESEVSKAARDAKEGVALGLALPSATVDAGKTFGAAVNIGTFGGESALGLSGAYKADNGFTFSGGMGVGLGRGTMGGRAGVNFSW